MLAAIVIAALGLLQPAPPAGPSVMRWARGLVSSVSDTELTLKLRATSITIALDPATVFESVPGAAKPSVGAVVEVHYNDKKDVHHAVLILHDGPGGSTELSRKPGRSYRGVIQGNTKGTLKLVLNKKTQPLDLDAETRLVDAKGQLVATGKKEFGSMLKAGDEVLVKYDEGDKPESKTKALEVRRLKKST